MIKNAAAAILLLLLTSAVTTAQMSHQHTTGAQTTKAIAVLSPTEGNNVHGTITFTKTDEGMKIVADIEGLTPGKHGIHIHEFGDCSAPDATSAGGHYNPDNKPHRGPEAMDHHIGDLGNITAESDGKAHLELTMKDMELVGNMGVLGRAVVLHASEDDLMSQPAGNSGARIACGVIGIAK